MAKTKVQKGFYPIYARDIRRKIGYCEVWGYGNKDTCKYVAETIIEDIALKDEMDIIGDVWWYLYQRLISIVHDINSGRISRLNVLIKIGATSDDE